MSDFDLSQKFPDLRRAERPPTLSNTKGFGMHLVGKRDFDPETESYVMTYAFCFFYIPLVAVGAYRVIDAPGGGWYCLGRVPLSGGRKLWNAGLVAAVLTTASLVGWHFYTNTPDYIAGKQLEEADKLAAEGKSRRAAEIYREVMGKPTKHAEAARGKLRGLIESPTGSLDEVAGVYRIALDMQRQNDTLVPDLFDRGMRLAESRADEDPRGALALVETIAPLAPNPRAVLATRQKLLETLSAADPNDVQIASRLATVYDAQGEAARCEKLLTPFADRLGDLDGAAILGRIYSNKGNLDGAHALLEPYVRSHLPKLHAAQATYEAAIKRVQDQVVADLKSGNAPNFNYDQAERAAPELRQVILQKYLSERIKLDVGVRAARENLSEHAEAVSAALDLGVVLLQRAQAKADPEQRRRELEQAEKVFIDIRGVAGETDSYRINLGQVYYWLGKHEDGRKEFEELLKSRNRAPMLLLGVSQILREVGDVSSARAMAEEAYQKEPDAAKKKQAASIRSLMPKDLDDEILWLGRADVESPETKAQLNTSRGRKAEQDGNDEQAASFYRAALDAYSQLPESAATLNNSALPLFALYQLTHDNDYFVRAMDRLDRAVALKPGDSILLHNAASFTLEAAVRDVAGAAVDLKTLRRRAGLDVLPFLYRDAAGRAPLVEQFRKHPGAVKARGYSEKLMILAPKRDDAYAILESIHATTRDAVGLRSVLARLEKVELDLGHENQLAVDLLRGKTDPAKLEEQKKAVARQEATLAAARAKGGTTFAVAAAGLVRGKIALAYYGTPPDVDALVRLAEEAHTAAPSDGSESLLVQALLFRAHAALAKADKEYGAMAARYGRSLSASLLTYVLGGDGPLRDKALANADVKRALALRLESWRKNPEEHGPTTWALLRGAYPQDAAKIAEAVTKDAVGELTRQIQARLSPLSGTVALEQHLALRIAGKDAQAAELFKQYAARGVPLPEPGK